MAPKPEKSELKFSIKVSTLHPYFRKENAPAQHFCHTWGRIHRASTSPPAEVSFISLVAIKRWTSNNPRVCLVVSVNEDSQN